jgi:hypothetical protein
LNNILSNDIENVVSISLLPFTQLFNIGLNCNQVFTNCNFDFLFTKKYVIGITAHKNWANAVAIAAHKIHNLNRYIKTKSNIIFDTHTTIATFNHKSGLSFTMKKL